MTAKKPDPIQTTLEAIGALRDDIDLTRRSNQRTQIVLVIAIVLGALLFLNAWRLDAAQDSEGHERSCAIAEAVDRQRDVLLAASATSDEPDTPQRQASIDRYNADTDALIGQVAPTYDPATKECP